jgi:hypothetical protein
MMIPVESPEPLGSSEGTALWPGLGVGVGVDETTPVVANKGAIPVVAVVSGFPVVVSGTPVVVSGTPVVVSGTPVDTPVVPVEDKIPVVVGIPVVGVPVVGIPVVGIPVVGTPVVGIPVVGIPVVGTPVVGIPVVGIPVVGTPVVVGIPVVGFGHSENASSTALIAISVSADVRWTSTARMLSTPMLTREGGIHTSDVVAEMSVYASERGLAHGSALR